MKYVDRIKYFECVLSLIKNETIRSFCERLLNDADDYFFIEPSSSSGKYHPEYALGVSGLARHSISVALIMNEIIRTGCYNFTDDEKDLLICAAIVHDIKKYGDGKAFTVKNHPELAASYIIEENEKFNCLDDSMQCFLYQAILTHMGNFGKEKPETDAQKLLHIADCLASRRYLEVNFDKVEFDGAAVIKESVIKPNEEPGDYVLNFGIHKGKKLKEIDLQYIDFLANKFEHKTHPVVAKAKQYLMENK